MQSYDRQRQGLAVSLACLAGYVDAVGFLSAGSYFVSFMSGNTTRLAVDLATDWRTAVTPALLIAGFVFGVASGALVAIRSGQRRKPLVLGIVASLLICAAIADSIDQRTVSLAFLVMAMGALNNTFQRDGEVTIGLTYMTGALVRLGQAIGAALAGERRSGWGGYLLLWAGLALGALGGALASMHWSAMATWLAAFAATGLALLAGKLKSA